MEHLELLSAGKTFLISHHANGDELLFYETDNKVYFRKLLLRHLNPVCEIVSCELLASEITLILKFHEPQLIPEKYRGRVHLPLPNLFNSYVKAMNRRYDRKGSLFRTRFERKEIILS